MSNNINTMMIGAVDHLSAALALLYDLSKTDLPESAKDAIERVSVSVRDASLSAVDIIPTVCGEVMEDWGFSGEILGFEGGECEGAPLHVIDCVEGEYLVGFIDEPLEDLEPTEVAKYPAQLSLYIWDEGSWCWAARATIEGRDDPSIGEIIAEWREHGPGGKGFKL